MKEPKGKLYIHYNTSFKSQKGEHTEVLHGVKKSKVKDHIEKRKQLVKTWNFIEARTNRQVRLRGSHTNLNTSL